MELTGKNKFEAYEIIEVHRSQLKNAPYNPRRISEKARKKLKENLLNRGLMMPPVWNKRTGHIVAGHQRVDILDSLMGTKDYTLKVAAVDLDEQAEKEQNVFMNNPDAMGDWDLEKLEKLFTEDKIDFTQAGFDLAEVYQTFGDNPLAVQPEKLEELAEQLRKSREVFKKVQERLLESDNVYDAYLVVVFKDHASRKAFTDALGLPDNRFVDARDLEKLLRSQE